MTGRTELDMREFKARSNFETCPNKGTRIIFVCVRYMQNSNLRFEAEFRRYLLRALNVGLTQGFSFKLSRISFDAPKL